MLLHSADRQLPDLVGQVVRRLGRHTGYTRTVSAGGRGEGYRRSARGGHSACTEVVNWVVHEIISTDPDRWLFLASDQLHTRRSFRRNRNSRPDCDSRNCTDGPTRSRTFQRAQQLSRPSTRTGVLARIGLLRATMEQRNLAELTRSLRCAGSTTRSFGGTLMFGCGCTSPKATAITNCSSPRSPAGTGRLVKDLADSHSQHEVVVPRRRRTVDPVLLSRAIWPLRAGSSSQALAAAKEAKDAASVIRLLTHIGIGIHHARTR